MAVTDVINRSSRYSTRRVTGPANLIGPKSNQTSSDMIRLGGTRSKVDVYEFNTSGGYATNGTYTITIRPLAVAGLNALVRSAGDLVIFKQTGGTGAPTVLQRITVGNRTSSISTAGHTFTSSDKGWVVIERKDSSTLRYRIELDVA